MATASSRHRTGRARGSSPPKIRPLSRRARTPTQPRTVALQLDPDFVLRKVVPHEPFLGWDPDEVIGTFFSPTGFDAPTLRNLVDSLIASGTYQVDGVLPIENSEGVRGTARVTNTILVGDDGRFAGLHSTITLPD